MCLIASKTMPKNESFFKFNKEGFVYCWKEYKRIYPLGANHASHASQRLRPVFRHNCKPIKPGWIMSNRRTTKVPVSTDVISSVTDDIEIYRGIHVYNHCPVSHWDCVIVKVRCYKNDLVATSIEKNEAVFNKIFLEEEKYKKALRNYVY